jgi:ubiquinone biosynthesis monooxygenase Coq7
MLKRHFVDGVIADFDAALRVVTGQAVARRVSPANAVAESDLSSLQRRHSAGLMRVNHVGEICAQGLYQAQGRFARSAALREQFAQAGQEEEDHLAWTAGRLAELGSHRSLLNPLWYAGAYALGVAAAKLGDANSLRFVVETERQVEAHLNSHLKSLPEPDHKSLAVVVQMSADEAAHRQAAMAMGAKEVPPPVRKIMEVMAKVMTSTAYFI